LGRDWRGTEAAGQHPVPMNSQATRSTHLNSYSKIEMMALPGAGAHGKGAFPLLINAAAIFPNRRGKRGPLTVKDVDIAKDARLVVFRSTSSHHYRMPIETTSHHPSLSGSSS
jgi:hypothetical protein